jgi:hypothetical protein
MDVLMPTSLIGLMSASEKHKMFMQKSFTWYQRLVYLSACRQNMRKYMYCVSLDIIVQILFKTQKSRKLDSRTGDGD